MQKQVVLIVLDGWGHAEAGEHNAISKARTPFFNSLWEQYPHGFLHAAEEHVGLPKGTIGNSEIGHMTMGAGKRLDTELVRISKAVSNNELGTNPVIRQLFEHVKANNSSLHLVGMVSPIGVHSHQEHLHGLLRAAKAFGLTQVVIHAITDGRDAPPQGNAEYLAELEKVIGQEGIGYIATATGRYYAMDRDKNWHRTEKAEKALFECQGRVCHNRTPSEVLKELYQQGELDEYLEPVVFVDESGKTYPIQTNDGVFFFNFRTDRPRQLSTKISEHAKAKNLYFVTMTQYHPELEATVAFPPLVPDTTLAGVIAESGLGQSHIAETEKYGHVTFFFNGGKQTPHELEHHILIESRKDIATHDQAPQMRAKEICDAAITRLKAGDSFVLLNFANADMVGHTANQPAIIRAVETIDTELSRVVKSALSQEACVLITADHGNAEVNVDPQTHEKHTAHTTNIVPFILASEPKTCLTEAGPNGVLGSLADIAPTILALLNLHTPPAMTGKSLLSQSDTFGI